MFDISADEYIFSKEQINKTSLRRQIDSILDTFDDKDLTIIEGTTKAICKAKELKKQRSNPLCFLNSFRKLESPNHILLLPTAYYLCFTASPELPSTV